MDVIWYPGCGQDFNPVLTLLPSNPRREHVPDRAPDSEVPILWMTDYRPEVAQYFDGLQTGSRVAFASLRVKDDLAEIVLPGCEVVVRDVRRFNFDYQGAELTKQKSSWRWFEYKNPPNADAHVVDPGNIPSKRHDKALEKLQNHLFGKLPADEQVRLKKEREKERFQQFQNSLQIHPPSSVRWDVTELTLEARQDRSRQSAQELKVWFSPFESEAAVEHAFNRLNVRIDTLMLVRLGGYSNQRLGVPPLEQDRNELDHHGPEFFALLSEHARATETNLPSYILTDRDTSTWDTPNPYSPTGVAFLDWVEASALVPDWRVVMLKKR